MKTLLTLIKRQVADNAAHFAVAGAVSLALTVSVVSVVLAESLDNLSGYAVTLILGAPLIIGVGSFLLGVVQMHSDRMNGLTAMLSTLPVGRTWILLVRFMTGAMVIMTALAPLAVTGTILWTFLGPPEWLFHEWVSDSVVGLFLASLTCLFFGFAAGLRAETFLSALRALPLAPVIVLLIVVKGFGWPLLVVVVPLFAVLILRCWCRSTCSFVMTATTGLIVLVMFAVPLYLARHLCDGLLMGHINAGVRVSPSGLLPPEIENDPNVEGHSSALASVRRWYRHRSPVDNLFRYHYEIRHLLDRFYLIQKLGIVEYFESRERGRRNMYSAPYHELPHAFRRVHIDEIGGQLVCHRKISDTWADGFSWEWTNREILYGGPRGVSNSQEANIGRFESLVVYLGPRPSRFSRQPKILVYDQQVPCFYAIDFERETVKRGPQLQDSSFGLVELGISEDSDLLGAHFDPPYGLHRFRVNMASPIDSGYLPVVYGPGRIDLLDLDTLELSGPAGYLPEPRTLFGKGSPRPKDLLDYAVNIVTLEPLRFTDLPPNPDYPKKVYLGLVAGSLSRQGLWTAVAVFDKDGNKIRSDSSEAGFFEKPWGPLLTVTKYVFESLHPPILTFASFWTAYSFEARASHRAIFLMPNSFAAMVRDRQGNIIVTLAILLLVMLPGVALAGWLSCRVMRDATMIGLSLGARRFWLAATLAFGLAGYITYRLSRPRFTLVTCANCGKGRRPDMDICHHCGEGWDVPELTPPAWRVFGERPEQDRQGDTEAD